MSVMMLFAGNSIAEGRYGKQKVVYHINYDNPKAQAGALRNIQNHINAVGAENLDLKVVMHGKGLSLLLEPDALTNTKLKLGNANDEMQAKISGLKDQGVDFNVCANTLRGKKISYEDDLYDVSKADIVPSGVAELAHLQSMGYTYIKP
ncbi:MAG: DsrE family protein [Pseudomonadota bacterium]